MSQQESRTSSSLRQQTFAGIRWTALSSLVRAVLQFAQLAILARLLAPADFGLFAVVMGIVVILQIFADAGVSTAIIHYQEITHEQLSSLYWLNVGISLVLGVGLVTAGPVLATYYHDDSLEPLLLLAAINLVVAASSQQLRIVAQKNLEFGRLAKIELTAAFVGFGVAVRLAIGGAGVYALMVGLLATSLVTSALAWIWLARGWRPRLRVEIREIAQFLRFGGFMIGDTLANTFNAQVDVLLGGALVGLREIGLYGVPKNLALRISQVINPIVTRVGLPVMAKAQDDEALLRRFYLGTIRMTASVNFPIYVALGVFAPEVVHLVLGPGWEASIPLLQLFVVWSMMRSIGNPVGSLLLARGRADLSFKWNACWLVIIPTAVWIGSQSGVVGITVSITALSVIGFVPNWYFLVRPMCGASLGEYSQEMVAPLVLSLFAAGVASVCIYALAGDVARVVVGGSVFALVYVALSWRFNRVWWHAIVELLGH